MAKGTLLMMILASALVTFLIRALPFLIVRGDRELPPVLAYLGRVLPPAVIAMLVVYALRYTPVVRAPYGLPEAIGVLAVVVLHGQKRNNMLSIIGGTAVYMYLVQVIF
jgi:branched-subunit amino acid transport protein AzlD